MINNLASIIVNLSPLIVLAVPFFVYILEPCISVLSQSKDTGYGSSDIESIDRDAELLKIREQWENRERYIPTLWWGFDGLRLNDDGSTEWISRRKKPTVPEMFVPEICGLEAQPLNDTRYRVYVPDPVVELQRQLGVKTDGIIGPETLAAMANAHTGVVYIDW